MAAEADGQDIEDNWVQGVFVVCMELHITPEQVGEMSAFSFNIFLEELAKKYEREKAEMTKSKNRKFR